MKRPFAYLLCCLALPCAHAAGPVIDMHRHGAWPGSDDAAYVARTLDELDRAGVVLAVLSITEPADTKPWLESAPGRFRLGPRLPCPRDRDAPRRDCFPDDGGWPDLHWLRREVEAGRITVLHELAPSYHGISPANPRLAPYWALAAEFDLPVGVHTQRGPRAGAPHSARERPGCCPEYDPEMGNPALLRPVLQRHPGLRVWIQHVGAGRGDHAPFADETLALLRDFPNVHVDLSITNGAMPADQHAATLKWLVDAGFGDRILFGSDNLPLGESLARLDRIAWLTAAQRRAIRYGNAARFLGLDAATVARHHGR